MKQLHNDNRGAALVYIMITVVIAGILTTGLMALIVNRVRYQAVDNQKTQEYYLADGVVEIIKRYSDQEGTCKSLILEFTGLSSIANTADEPSTKGEIALHYTVSPANQCHVVYYGLEYCTEIKCIWKPINGNEILTYEVTQTPRTASETTAENGGAS